MGHFLTHCGIGKPKLCQRIFTRLDTNKLHFAGTCIFNRTRCAGCNTNRTARDNRDLLTVNGYNTRARQDYINFFVLMMQMIKRNLEPGRYHVYRHFTTGQIQRIVQKRLAVFTLCNFRHRTKIRFSVFRHLFPLLLKTVLKIYG